MELREGRAVFSILVALAVAPVIAPDAKGQQPTDITLTAEFANGQTVYRVGETISLQLAFAASLPNTYAMSTRSYDRSGRLNLEEFHVSPAGRDPLYNYYNGGLFAAFLGGGLFGGPRYLGSEPQIIQEDLNEWVALDKPGQYSLYVTSGRITRRVGSKWQPIHVRSNTLSFEVIEATPGWQHRAVASATAVLGNSSSTQEEKRSAFRTLRFLDSTGSIAELVRQLGDPKNKEAWDCVAGLIGSSHQELVVRELEAKFALPDTAITADYTLTLAATQFLLNRGPLSAYPAQNPEQQKVWRSRLEERLKSFGHLRESLYEQALNLIGSKTGAAQAETVRALLMRPYSSPYEMKPIAGLPANILASAFSLLNPDEQARLLESFWARLNVPAMEGPLEAILDQPEIPHQTLRDSALRRLYKLDPGDGRRYVLAEIRQPHVDRGIFTVSGKSLGLLPDKTLPRFDELLANRLAQQESYTKDLDAQLIGRYATKAILARIERLYAPAPEGTWDCAAQSGLMTYFLRLDPDYAVEHLKGLVGPCDSDAFRVVTKMGRWPEVEPSVIQQLDNPNVWIARAAAETLAKYGGPNAEAAMWERLRKFHRQWAPREKELWNSPQMAQDASNAIDFEFGLAEALGKAQGWILSNSQITELECLSLGQLKDEVSRWHWHSPLNLSVTVGIGNPVHADINGIFFEPDMDSLRAKLAQFPSGTEFHLRPYGTEEQVRPVIQAIRNLADEHGLVVKVERAN